jgi:putative transposase
LAAVPAHFQLAYQERKRVRNYLRRVIRRNRGNRPFARLSRSINLDADMYTLVENIGSFGKKVQFLKVMGLESGKRMVIPLTGYSTFSGNIRLVLDFVKQRVEVHTINELVESEPLNGELVALDVGITEVFTDDAGVAYEPTFGKVLTTASDQLNRTGKSRNKAHILRKKSGKHKAQRIRKYNLGKNKMRERKRKGQIRVQQMISQAIRTVARTKKPNTIITERLDIRGKAKSKRMSRIVSYWMRSALKERLEFLALVECFHHKQVNPAYSSQMCPTCLFVDKGNRVGDKFKCLNCGHTEHADRVAAKNLLARANDPDITIYTPKSVVRSILQDRFIASLQRQSESAIVAAPSVSGRTGAYENAASERNAVAKSPHRPNGAVQECLTLSTF